MQNRYISHNGQARGIMIAELKKIEFIHLLQDHPVIKELEDLK